MYEEGDDIKSPAAHTKTEIKSHTMRSVFKSFHTQNVTGLQVTVHYSDIFTAFLRTSKRKTLLTVVPYRQSSMAHLLPSLTLHFQKYHTSSASALKVKVQTIAHAQYQYYMIDQLWSVCMHLLTVVVTQNFRFSPEFSQCMTE